MITFSLSIVIVYGLLTIALLSVWLPNSVYRLFKIPVWAVVFTASALAGLYFGIVEPAGLAYLVALTAICHLTKHSKLSLYIRIPAGIVVALMVAALFLHAVPFFNNPLVFDQYYFSERSAVYTKYWNYDKAAAGLILLIYFGEICRSKYDWINFFKQLWTIAIITIVLSLLAATLFGYIEFDITFTAAFFAWAWANLFFTCVAEEMLFRGLLQQYFLTIFKREVYRLGVVVFVGLLFGLAHFAGGMMYIVVASIAGVGYSYAYYRTGRIEAAILTHFLLNAVHLLFFTYPFSNGII